LEILSITGGFRFESTTLKAYTAVYPEEYISEPGDILLVMTCQTAGGEILGIPGRIPNDGRTYLHNQRLGKPIITAPSRIDKDFLYWLFLSPDFNRELFLSASGTKILHTAPNRIEAFQFLLPPIAEQKAIAHILGTLDDKIELNQQTNQTLESIARALFKSWFIDFDPVRAKMDGRQPAGMDAETAALFPSEFEDSALGKIPKGWKITNLGEQTKFFTGYSFKSKHFISQYEGEYKLARGDNVKEGVFQWGDKAKYWKALTPELEKYQLNKNDILIGMDGSKVGKNWVRVQEHHLPILLVQRVACLRARSPMSPFLIRFLVGSTEFANYVELVRTGTSIPHVSGKQIQTLEFPFPDKATILEKFHKIAMPLFNRFDSHDEEISTLTSIRDSLLPKLLSGEIRVKDAEKVVEAVV